MNASDYLTLEWYTTMLFTPSVLLFAPTGKLGKWTPCKKAAQKRGNRLPAMMKQIAGLLSPHQKVSRKHNMFT